jgi:hypothetical protein
VEVNPPLDVLPLWVRAGAVLPLGPEMDFVDQHPLDPLTLELWHPQAAGEYEIHDEEQPPIRVSYRLQGDRLSVDTGPAPGSVELVLYGLRVRSAERNGAACKLETSAAAQRVRFDGRQAGTLSILLGPPDSSR